MKSNNTRWFTSAVLALIAVSGSARSEVVNFEWSGTIVFGTYMAKPGDKITGTFGYDTDTERAWGPPRTGRKEVPGDTYYVIPPPFTINGKVGPHTITTQGLVINVTNNAGKDMMDSIVISGGYAMILDGTTFPGGILEIDLTTAPGKAGVFRDGSLPTSIDVRKFDEVRSYGVLLMDGGPSGGLLQFTVDEINLVRRKKTNDGGKD